LQNLKRKLSVGLVVALVLSVVTPVLVQSVRAGALSNTSIRLSRMKTGVGTDLRLVFKTPAVNSTEGQVVITFPAAFTINATQATSVANCPTETTSTALPGTLSASGDNTAHTITISGVSDLSISTFYCVDLTTTTAITNPTSGGYMVTVSTQTSGGSPLDSRDVGLRIITDDQIVVSAVVPPIFEFDLNSNVDSFTTNLDPSSVVSTGGRTATITTNASKGWITWVRDLNRPRVQWRRDYGRWYLSGDLSAGGLLERYGR
jgi:hypothetical protein